MWTGLQARAAGQGMGTGRRVEAKVPSAPGPRRNGKEQCPPRQLRKRPRLLRSSRRSQSDHPRLNGRTVIGKASAARASTEERGHQSPGDVRRTSFRERGVGGESYARGGVLLTGGTMVCCPRGTSRIVGPGVTTLEPGRDLSSTDDPPRRRGRADGRKTPNGIAPLIQ